MTKENNVRCTRVECKYHKGFYSLKLAKTGELPEQCPRCKRYGTVEKLN